MWKRRKEGNGIWNFKKGEKKEYNKGDKDALEKRGKKREETRVAEDRRREKDKDA